MCGLHTHSWKILSSYEDEMLIINVSLWFSVPWTMFNIVLGGAGRMGRRFLLEYTHTVLMWQRYSKDINKEAICT